MLGGPGWVRPTPCASSAFLCLWPRPICSGPLVSRGLAATCTHKTSRNRMLSWMKSYPKVAGTEPLATESGLSELKRLCSPFFILLRSGFTRLVVLRGITFSSSNVSPLPNLGPPTYQPTLSSPRVSDSIGMLNLDFRKYQAPCTPSDEFSAARAVPTFPH